MKVTVWQEQAQSNITVIYHGDIFGGIAAKTGR